MVFNAGRSGLFADGSPAPSGIWRYGSAKTCGEHHANRPVAMVRHIASVVDNPGIDALVIDLNMHVAHDNGRRGACLVFDRDAIVAGDEPVMHDRIGNPVIEEDLAPAEGVRVERGLDRLVRREVSDPET